MLYVFQMDVGQMLTFDISLLTDSVSRLQHEIFKVTGIATDQQILLMSGGHSLQPDQKVMTYGAGADTNPVFLFSKLAITSQEPPLVKSFGVPKDVLGALKAKVLSVLNMPPGFETAVSRTKVAVQIRDSAASILKFCNSEFKEQHLQHQGWNAVVANLEEIAEALQKTKGKFSKVFSSFLPLRDKHFGSLSDFQGTLDLLSRIPILKSLKESDIDLGEDDDIEIVKKSLEQESRSLIISTPVPTNLLEWITTQGQGQSVEGLQLKCYNELVMFNEEMFDAYEGQVRTIMEQVNSDPTQMKELVGISRRLSDLERCLNEAKKIAKTQQELAQAFLIQQSRLNSTPDSSVLPDLCSSHRRQLQQMYEGQQRIEALQNNFRKSKQEMSTNIHQRLSWVVHVETQISQLDSELIFHMKTLKILEMNLDLLGQVKAAPTVYADMIMEAARRKHFSHKFLQWAAGLVDDSKHLYDSEVQCRNQFMCRHGKHFFLHTLFKGFEDMPPSFATKAPAEFDNKLPAITKEEISALKTSIPELEETLSLPIEVSVFPEGSLTKRLTDSPMPTMVLPNSQSSQTEWTQVVPSVITATETPATAFTLPELQESHATEYLPAVSSMTDTMRDVMTVRPTEETHSSKLGAHPASSSASLSDDKSSKSSASGATSSDKSGEVTTGQPVPKTNSIPTESPHSSNEFATADFYIEEAMPSPMRSKSDSQTISSLQAEVMEKWRRIQDLEALLKARGIAFEKSTCSTPKSASSEDSSSVTVVAADNADSSGRVVTSHSSVTDNIEIVALEHVEGAGEKGGRSQMERDLEDLQKKLHEKDRKIDELNKCVHKCEEDLKRVVSDLHGKDSLLVSTKMELTKVTGKCDSLSEEVSQGEVTLCRIKDRLKDFRDNIKFDIPKFRKNLDDLKQSVVKGRDEIDNDMRALMRSVNTKVNAFNCTVLAEANSEFQIEKTALLEDIQKLQSSQSEKTETISQLRKLNFELTSRNSEKEKELMSQLAAQTEMSEVKLKEMETKHSLELEIELDKCRSELRKQLEESERSLESQVQMKEELTQELTALKESQGQARADLLQQLEDARREREGMERLHTQRLEELESKRAAEKESAATTLAQFEIGLDEKLRSGNLQIEQLQSQLNALEKSLDSQRELTAEKDSALQTQKAELVEQHTTALSKQLEELSAAQSAALDELRAELAEGHKAELEREKKAGSEGMERLREELKDEHKENLASMLEGKQLEYAEKLTELKVQFDLERESLQSQLAKLRDLPLTTSETQTGMELLAEVISLTSSASYGSEEMIANRQLHSLGEEKDTMLETTNKMQQTIEDLTTQLRDAQETITSLSSELSDTKSNLEVLQSQGPNSDKMASVPSNVKLPMFGAADGATGGQSSDLPQSTDTNITSFILMDKDPSAMNKNPFQENEMRAKDERIAQLEKRVMEMSMSSLEKEISSDKVSIRGCDEGDLVLLCLDERHNQYVVFTVGTNLHFLHSESLDGLGLKSDVDASRKTWILAEVVDKEYCLAKKPNNRFRVPQGTCFYRVRCKPWKCDADLTKAERDLGKQGKVSRPDAKTVKLKKSDKKN